MKITQHSLFLSQLLRDVASGTLLPAAFQRRYVWREADVLALIESIMRGYPIGGFLLWTPLGAVPADRFAELERNRLGPLAAGTASVHSLLLDGQNRLATLAWLGFDYSTSLPTDLSPEEAQTWAPDRRLQLNLATQQVQFVPADELDKGFTLPGYVLAQQKPLRTELFERWDTQWAAIDDAQKNAGIAWIDQCERAFMNARVVVTDISDATVEEAQDAFLHICKVGVPMAPEDFEGATKWALPT